MRYSRAGYWGATAAGIGVLALGMLIITQVFPHGPSLMKAGALVALATASIGIVLLSYRSADEIILAGHKTAWFWSSMASCTVLVAVMFTFGWGFLPVPLLLPHFANAPAAYFIEGMLFVVLLQTLGFSAIMAYLRLRNGTP
jgi:hypothetical protein